jgi:hypothetical protein
MGTQQLLLIIVGLIVISVAIGAGVNMFGSGTVSANRDALLSDINHLGTHALEYRFKLRQLGGGGGSYLGYVAPSRMTPLEDGSFEFSIQPNDIVITATSAYGFGTVQGTIDSTGTVSNLAYTGDFQ